ncbi:MAG: class I fructose-bisphosphate aldolase [Pseudomonadota bacterium]|nr:class I fructose-bisphosphate aldolase [Pseudomonadota bacterium]
MSLIENTIDALTLPGRGILAADESTPTITKRLKEIQVDSTPESRYDYRHLLLSTPNLNQYIGGVILFEESLNQTGPFGKLTDHMQSMQIGIKVDKGLCALPNTDEEKITEGLDGLGQRLDSYKEAGARFTKWRCVYDIDTYKPSELAIDTNAEILARYAAIAQAHDFVPIVEPEVLHDGTHTIDQCYQASCAALEAVFIALKRHRVDLEYMILKPNMIAPGKKSKEMINPEEVAHYTLNAFMRHVPAAVPSINFLSGGIPADMAHQCLQEMNKIGDLLPWRLSYSFARALQEPCMQTWLGKEENKTSAQEKLLEYAQKNSECLADFGQ